MVLMKQPEIPKKIIIEKKNEFSSQVPEEWKDYLWD